MNLSDMVNGARVRIAVDMDIWPTGYFKAGLVGTVVGDPAPNSCTVVARVLLDEHQPDLDDWSNVLQVFSADEGSYGPECWELASDEPVKPWGVWCEVSGGVTGSRAAWAKHDGAALRFATEAEAEAEAARCLARVSAAAFLRAHFSYSARRVVEG